ncbi:MAG TPA: hypothetical protein VMM60_17850 [Ilumatobacter sp.]|nr:hypothetical protein [Ilumatobacter sp.]
MNEAKPSGDSVEHAVLRHATKIVVIGGTLTVAVAVFAVFAPRWGWLLDDPRPNDLQAAKADLRQTALRIAAGIAAFTAGLLAWARLELSREQHRHDKTRDERQRLLAEQSQQNERFARSVELLGADNDAVQLGGLYALEALARDGYRVQSVYDVICAFARLHVPDQLPATIEEIGAEQQESQPDDDAGRPLLPDLSVGQGPSVPSEAYEAALTIALRVGQTARIDLTRTIISGRVITSLSECELGGAQITGCTFGPHLSDVQFSRARITDSSFEGTLSNCSFAGATLTSVRFANGTRLEDCRWDSVTLRDTEVPS